MDKISLKTVWITWERFFVTKESRFQLFINYSQQKVNVKLFLVVHHYRTLVLLYLDSKVTAN
jgi:hypothetical protein